MSEAKHTPGPWAADYDGTPGHIKSIAPRPDGSTPTVARYDLCAVSLSPEEVEANKHLLTAAPDLYAACELVLAGVDSGQLIQQCIDQMRAAVRKARG